MRVQLRPFQATVKAAIVAMWLTVPNVLAVAATGSGKTVLFSDIVADEPNPSCVIAHRQELVSQISLALARNGVPHRIIGSKDLQRECTAGHLEELRANYVDPNSRVAVASVDTLIRMDATAVTMTKKATFKYEKYIDVGWTDAQLIEHGYMKSRGINDPWFASVRLWVMDEAHHLLRENKWGRAVDMFPNARGLGVTAETERADGRGLGAWNDGVFHTMVQAPGMRDIIDMDYLTDYRVFVPPSDLNLADVDVTASGDFSHTKLVKATRNSHITGDVVKHYLAHAAGKLGITFAVDVEAAQEIAKSFRDAGVPAEVVTSKTPDALRRSILRRFRKREILQLVNVDLFGEGFDLPAIEVVSMARATQSFNLYKQQFGRALRKMLGKQWAIIVDHVGNVIRHGLPDRPRLPSLERREKRSKALFDEDIIPMTVCVDCSSPYERYYANCPHCGYEKPAVGRSAPELVDGNLLEITADILAKMRGTIAQKDNFVPIPQGVAPYVEQGIKNRHHEQQQAQSALRAAIALWAGWQKSQGLGDDEIYKLFYLGYGTDVMTAQLLPTKEAVELRERLQARLDLKQIVAHV